MRIIEFFKKIIEVKDNDLSFLNVGDIIWAKRYKNDEEKSRIKMGHQESPYVVIKKSKGKVYALQCTSNPHWEIQWKMAYYPLGKLNYQMKKNSFINCMVVYELKEIQFVEMIGHLNDVDLNQLKKQLYIFKNSGFKVKPDIEEKYLDFKIGVGDVILYNGNKYYIDSIKGRSYEVYRLKKHPKVSDRLLIGNTYYSFIFRNIEKIKIRSKYDLVDTFNTGEIEIINKYKEKSLKLLEKRMPNSLRVGSLIDYKNRMFYVYEKRDDCVNCYEIYSNEVFEEGMADILVKGGIYKTFFATVTIPIEKLDDNGYKIRRCASSEEIEYNKNIFSLPKKKRVYARRRLANIKEKNIDDFVPMVILKDLNNGNYYLIIDMDDNVIELVNVNDIGDTFYFELEKNHCPFEYYRVMSKEEYNMYLKKIKDLKEMCAVFSN